jgi:hypothetical protein
MKRQALRGLVPSLFVLGAVFYFINSACLKSGGETIEGVPLCDQGALAPKGASIAIESPRDGQTFTIGESGKANVDVMLNATGVNVASASTCAPATGHFHLVVTPASFVCPAVTLPLETGALSTSLRLARGNYTIDAVFIGMSEQRFAPELNATAHIQVLGGSAPAPFDPCKLTP